jgi:hypothetical protein
MLFAYFGPETVLPATSVLAACVGFFLMFGRRAGRLAVAFAGRLLLRRPKAGRDSAAIPRPHLPGFHPRPLRQGVEIREVAASRDDS